MSFRLRLALWYGLLLGLTLLGFCVALYFGLAGALERDLDEVLRLRAQQVDRALQEDVGDDAELTPEEVLPGALEPSELEDFAEPGVYVQVISPRGQVIATSGTSLPVEATLVAQAAEQGEAFDTISLPGGQRLRSLYRAVHVQEHVVAIVQVAETLQLVDETMEDARNLMLGGAFVLLAFAVASGLFLTRRALRPVAEVTEAARHIAETGTFERRLAPTTPRDELTDLVNTFNLMIARLERMLTHERQFLADTSHELRTPLSIIRGNLDYLRRVTRDQSCLESIHEAELEAIRMSRLVDDLLLLAQEDAAQFLHQRPIRADELVREVVEQARGLAVDQQVEIVALEPLVIEADPDRLRQVIWNLLDNALRYAGAGCRIAVALRRHQEVAAIEVADNGPGIPTEHEQRVFDRFYRVDASRNRATGGAGLGLAIVKHIVEAHGGSVSLENRPGAGARFTIVLPLARTSPDLPVGGAGLARRLG